MGHCRPSCVPPLVAGFAVAAGKRDWLGKYSETAQFESKLNKATDVVSVQSIHGYCWEAAAPPVQDPCRVTDRSTLRRWFRDLDSSQPPFSFLQRMARKRQPRIVRTPNWYPQFRPAAKAA